MSLDDDLIYSPSYFWNCITFSEDCPFFTTVDPKLRYFGVGLAVLYGSFLLMLVGDLGFYWSLDDLQYQIDYYINLVRNKVKRVQKDQRRLMTTQERTEKQLKRSQEGKKIVTSLRGALSSSNPQHFSALTGFEDFNSQDQSEWSHVQNLVNYSREFKIDN